MSQAKKQPITRRAKVEPLITNLDPAAFPNVYGMKVIGDCMSPQFESGATLCFDKRAPVAAGDTVVVFLRPEVVPAGKMQAGVKRLATAIPSWVKSFPYEEHPDSNVTALVVLEMNNPPRSFAVECRHILAIHKCLGVARQKDKHGSVPPPMLPQHERVAASASEIRVELVSRRRFIRTAATLATVAAIPAAGLAALPDDPIFAAIEEHRKAQAAAEAFPSSEGLGPVGSPELKAHEAAFGDACMVVFDRAYDIMDIEPSTLAGASALLSYRAGCEPEEFPEEFDGYLIEVAARALARAAGGANG